MPKNPFGSSAKQGYISGHAKEADDLSFDRIKGALGNIQSPQEYRVGQSPIGFGNTNLTKSYDPYKFKGSGYTPQGYQETRFNMPGSLNAKGGIFAQTMNNLQRGLLRQQQGANNNFERTARLAGTYSPAMMKNMTLDSQRQTQEALGDYGAKGALDLATERARAEESMQEKQAAENMKGANFREDQGRYMADQAMKLQGAQADENQRARGLDLDAFKVAQGGEQIGLQADNQNKAYFTELLQKLFQNQIDPYAGQKGAQQATKGWLPGLLESGAKIASAFCLPKGTQIQTPTGFKDVEEIEVGDEVIGGKVLKTHSKVRPDGHQFYIHHFVTGDVVMSLGHPFYDSLLNVTEASHDSERTYDILTSEGYYFVNDVKLASTLDGGKNYGDTAFSIANTGD